MVGPGRKARLLEKAFSQFLDAVWDDELRELTERWNAKVEALGPLPPTKIAPPRDDIQKAITEIFGVFDGKS